MSLGAAIQTPFRMVAIFATLTLAALAERWLVMANPDVAWLLTVADKVLHGSRLYVDVLETNPPASVWLYMPFVLAEQAFGGSAERWLDATILIASAGSIWLAACWMPAPEIFQKRGTWVGALAYGILVLLPASCFGEREHVALIAFLPLIALACRRGTGLRVEVADWFGAALLVTFVACLKPHFIIALAAIGLAGAVVRRDWRALLQPEYVLGANLFFAYVAATFVWYPAFWSDMVPLSNLLYLPARLPVWKLLYDGFPAVVAALVAVGAFLDWTRRDLTRKAAWNIALAGSLGFLAVAILQGKGWGYHFYPSLGILLLLCGCAVIVPPPQPGRSSLVPLCATGLFALQFWMFFNAGLDLRFLHERMRAVAPNPRMTLLGSDFAVAFPAVRALHGTWVARSFSRWIPFHAMSFAAMPGTTEARKRIYQAAEDIDRRGFLDDVEQGRPDLILVERRPVDFLAWAREDEDLERLLTCYAPVDRAMVGKLDTPADHGLDIEFWRPRGAVPSREGCP